MNIKQTAILSSILFTLAGPSTAFAECYLDEDGNQVCDSLLEHAADVIEEVYQEYNDSDGDSDLEKITDDPYWDKDE